MASLPMLPMWVRDYLADTYRLNSTQHGMYLLLLFNAWMREDCDLPNDDRQLAGMACCTTRTWKREREHVMSFFDLDPETNTWRQKRLSQVREEAQSAHDRRVRAGQRSGEARRQQRSSNAEHSSNNARTLPNIQKQKHIQEEKPPSGGQKQTRRTRSPSGSRLSPDWVPSDEDIDYAVGEGLNREQIRRQAHMFKDHWIAATGRGATKKDWAATWRNWIRRSHDFH